MSETVEQAEPKRRGGIVLVLTAIIVRSIGNNRPTVTAAAPAPTVANQIEDFPG